jgi:geranylgeranyl diphosphate synthase type I
MDLQRWFDRFRDRLEAIELEMRACLLGDAKSPEPFFGMMGYHLGWLDRSFRPAEGRSGKRLRPLLCLLSCEVAGGAWRKALPAAAAVELLHTFTLVHDDIQDHSSLRWGRPTVWNVWGIPQAINVGDGLFVLARAALLRLWRGGIAPEVVLQAVERFDRTILTICEGQYMDLSFEGRLDVDEPAYLDMISRKTAALIETALHLGSLVAGAEAAIVEALRAYGRALGLAFQMQDDVLGVWGEEEHTGKPAAVDVLGRKLGLPIIHGLSSAAEQDRMVLARVYGGEDPVGEDEAREVLAILDRTGSRAYTEQQAADYHSRALEALGVVPAGAPRQALEDVAHFLLGRRV